MAGRLIVYTCNFSLNEISFNISYFQCFYLCVILVNLICQFVSNFNCDWHSFRARQDAITGVLIALRHEAKKGEKHTNNYIVKFRKK